MEKSKEYVLSKIKETLHQVAPDAKAILFGSRARNEARPDSDWDILILVDKPKLDTDDFDRISYPLYELGWKINEMISPILYTFKEWEKRSFTIFHKNVEEEGVVI
ncbi:nucleotidyltransferase domain-containing protein [Parabacteroides faecis]|uniref:nucleotidyltransferase domain-containing protein n=1 Tax=Parabacteroides faecis TaxID=1217282 RepID=UPI00216499F0|nr:nucleotidyltransferase domain-containing protein [Parabacteroides faecis]MCS2893170.1 nucleotidyltransferase domain-containing protein [Parabacteroides faecis]UVQ48220.1 nucleotidyltransferase domain-containing protein [Parabacteroides faecis]